MTKNIDFYFDFFSPYSYLAHFKLPGLAEKYGYSLTYKPIDLKAAKLAVGNTAPPTSQMPMKLRYAVEDLMRWSQKYGAPFSFAGGPAPTHRINKGTFFAIGKGQVREYVTAAWHATFGSGGNFDSDEVLSDIARQLGWAPSEFLAFLQSDKAEKLYDEGNKAAQERGVFGVPTMTVDECMFWGNDRLGMLEEYLAAHRPG